MKTYFNNKKLIMKKYLNNNMKMKMMTKMINYMHHKLEHRQMLEHRQIPNLSEFQLEVSV